MNNIKTDDIKEIKLETKEIKLETKEINYKKEKKARIETLTWELTEEEMESKFQYNLLKTLLESTKLTNMPIMSRLIRQHIKKKISSYRQQDINKKRLNNFEFVDYKYVIDLLISCELKCHYCASDIFLLYTSIITSSMVLQQSSQSSS